MSSAVRGAEPAPRLRMSSFVGRRRELDEVRRSLSASRLVTLNGPGGVGKTRLALEVGDAVRRVFKDGVVLVELEQLRDPELVVNTVAVAVGLREQAARPPLDMLIDYLATRRLLLVLDNSEHLLDAVTDLVGALLRGCPDLRIMLTSRECLGIPEEAVLTVPPLTLPDPGRSLAEQDLPHTEAVALFADRAASVLPGFELTPDNGVQVALICQRLDGLPLAIELAAARRRTLSEKEILDRLQPEPALPRPHDAPARQRTLRACIEWSYGLCAEREQALWARLSVFAGGFELDAAEEVAAGAGLAAEDVFDTVASLVDKSILAVDRYPNLVRYRMLETIREFGKERLAEAGELDQLRHAHGDWCLRLVNRADADWVSPRQVDWFERLDREHANVQAAVDRCLSEPGRLPSALSMLTALFHFYWWGRGWAREGRLWLARALDAPSRPTLLRAKALLTDGSLALADGDLDLGRQRLADARAIAATMADPEPAILAEADWVDGSAAMYSGDLMGSINTFEEGLGLLAADQDLPLRLDLLLSYSIAAGLVGDVARASACHQESLRITEPVGECFHRSYALWALGLLAMQQGDQRRAAELHRESLRLRRGVRDLTGAGWSLESLAWAQSAFGQHKLAANLLGAADRLWEIMGRPLETYQHLYPFHEQCEQTTRERLGDKRFQAEFERGRALDFDDAMAFALGEESAPEPETEAPPVLTKREHEIAELIAEGLTNKQIATRLMISVRTAETHAEHILTKLGFTSRVQVVAWVTQQQAGSS